MSATVRVELSSRLGERDYWKFTVEFHGTSATAVSRMLWAQRTLLTDELVTAINQELRPRRARLVGISSDWATYSQVAWMMSARDGTREELEQWARRLVAGE